MVGGVNGVLKSPMEATITSSLSLWGVGSADLIYQAKGIQPR